MYINIYKKNNIMRKKNSLVSLDTMNNFNKPDNPAIDVKGIVARVQQRLDELNITLADLNRKMGMSGGWYNNLIKRKSENIVKYIDRLANALQCNPVWLRYGEDSEFVRNILLFRKTSPNNKNDIDSSIASQTKIAKMRTGKIPYKLQEAHDPDKFAEVAMQDNSRNKILIYPDNPMDISENYIPVLVENELMSPKFEKGDMLIIDPKKQPKISNFVIARLHDKNENIFAQYFLDAESGKIIFKFIKSDYPIKVDADKVTIVGVVAEFRRIID